MYLPLSPHLAVWVLFLKKIIITQLGALFWFFCFEEPPFKDFFIAGTSTEDITVINCIRLSEMSLVIFYFISQQ